MRDAPTLLRELRANGIVIEVTGDRVRVQHPGSLSDELREAIRDLKPELLLLLQPVRPRPRTPLPDKEGWSSLRQFGLHLGDTVTANGKPYQLWGVTPRGAICFDGTILRTLDLEEVTLP